MSYMRGDLLSKTRKLVKGMAIAEPRWLKAMEQAPPPTFPRGDGKVKAIVLPEDNYVKNFHRRHPNAKYYEKFVNFDNFNPPPSQVFGWRVLELKKQGVVEEEAMDVADMEFLAERKAKKKAYSQLKNINYLQGKNPPPNPYSKRHRNLIAEELKFIRQKYEKPKTKDILRELTKQSATPLAW